MSVVRKVMRVVDKVLDTIFMVGVQSTPHRAEWSSDASTGASHGLDSGVYGKGFLYMTHEERGAVLQADREDRRRREQPGW